MEEAFRRWRAPPGARLVEMGLANGMKVADVGAGYGYFAFPAAEMVGEEGAVYAIEPDQKRAGEISRRGEERGVKNLRVLVTGAEDLAAISAGEVDVAFSMSSFHHFADPERALIEFRRVVKPGGLVYLRDIKAGRILKHGSHSREFRTVISRQFPAAQFEERSGYIVARARL